jgi:hypothetical protein
MNVQDALENIILLQLAIKNSAELAVPIADRDFAKAQRKLNLQLSMFNCERRGSGSDRKRK